jgi:FkbM family methyltransferase
MNFKSYLVWAQNFAVCRLLIWRFKRPFHDMSLIRLGTNYGGWWVPRFSTENLPPGSILISAGLGGDVSFDKEMLSRGFICIGLDPLKEAVEYSKSELADFPQYFPINSGLSNVQGLISFYAPRINEHDSWSVNNMHNTDPTLSQSFEVVTIRDLEQMFPILKNAVYRILKMDIEGGEIPVLNQIVDEEIKFDYLAVELDFLSLIPFFSLSKRLRHMRIVWRIMADLEAMGYILCKTENYNFCWFLNQVNGNPKERLYAKS